jgi:hypothetical protein
MRDLKFILKNNLRSNNYKVCTATAYFIPNILDLVMGGGKGKKDVNAKLTTNFINILKYKTNHL